MSLYTVGSTEFELVMPSAPVFNAFVDNGDRSILFANCIVRPSKEEWSRLFSAKPALKRKVADVLVSMAGDGVEAERLPDDGRFLVHRVGVDAWRFLPATEEQYDNFERDARKQSSSACTRLVKDCLDPDQRELFDQRVQTQPALLHMMARLLMAEAGMEIKVVEKK